MSMFPILLVAVTYVVTWLRYKLDSHSTGLLILFLILSLIHFLGLFLNGGIAQANTVFFDSVLEIFFEFTIHLIWVMLFYFLFEIQVVELCVKHEGDKESREDAIARTMKLRNRVLIGILAFGLVNVVIQVIEVSIDVKSVAINIIMRILSFVIEMCLFVFVQFKFSFVEATREESGLPAFHIVPGGYRGLFVYCLTMGTFFSIALMTVILSIIWSFPGQRTNLYVAFLRYILQGVIYPIVDVIICLSLCYLFLAQGKYLEKVNLLALTTDEREI